MRFVYLLNNFKRKKGSLKRDFECENAFLVADQNCKWVPHRPEVYCLQYQMNYSMYCSHCVLDYICFLLKFLGKLKLLSE